MTMGLEINGKGNWEPEEIYLLRQISDSAEDIILIFDEDRTVRFNSGAFQESARCSGYGKLLSNRDCESICKILRDPVETVFNSGRPRSVESSIEPHGWLHTRLTPISNGSRKVTGVLGIVRDISEVKRKEQLISSSRNELLRAIDCMPYMFAVIDRNHRITKANKALADHLGMDLPQLLGRICYRTFGAERPPRSCTLHRPGTDTLMSSKESLVNYSGKPFIVSRSALADEEGNTVGCIYIMRNGAGAVSGQRSKEENALQLRPVFEKAERIITVQDPKGKYLKLRAIPDNICLPEPILGKTPFDFFEPETAASICERINRVIDTDKDLTASVKLKLGDDEWHFKQYICPIKDDLGVVRSVMTISERIDAREEPGDFSGKPNNLSRRELEILQLIATGFTTSQIAGELFISKKTVQTHRTRIMDKLDIRKTSALIHYAVKSGLCK